MEIKRMGSKHEGFIFAKNDELKRIRKKTSQTNPRV